MDRERTCKYGRGPVRRTVEGLRGWKLREVMGKEGTWIVERRVFAEPSTWRARDGANELGLNQTSR